MILLPLPTPVPAIVQTQSVKAKIVRDDSQLEMLIQFSKNSEKLAKEWYPKIVDALGRENAISVDKITITMDLNYDGVAATGGTQISVSPKYVLKNPNDYGMIIHELTHVAQGYPQYDPVWLVEGIADYVRFFVFEPQTKIKINPDKANCRQSYRTTAAFLGWASAKYDKDLVKKLDKSLKTATFTEADFEKLTGKSLDTLNTEWLTSVRESAR